jgi:uncharacterized protein (DUF58 family)
LIAAAATTWVWIAANGARLVRSVGSPSVEENEVLAITVSMSRSRVPLPGGEVRAWAGGPALAVSGPGGSVVSSGVRFACRGRHQLSPASLLVADPLGLCSRAIASTADEVLVLPRVETVRFAAVGCAPAILGRQAVIAADAAATEVDSLQPLRPGTPASRIHWPTVARTATLMERRLIADGDEAPLVVVDPRNPSSLAALDRAMRAAASLCVHLALRGGCALLLPGDRRPTPIDAALCGFAESHARLAVLAPEAGAPASGCVTGANVVLWVTAALGAAAALEADRARIRYLVSPHPSRARPVQFTVAGCAGQRLDGARSETQQRGPSPIRAAAG